MHKIPRFLCDSWLWDEMNFMQGCNMTFKSILTVSAVRAVRTLVGFLPCVNQEVTLQFLFPCNTRERVPTQTTWSWQCLRIFLSYPKAPSTATPSSMASWLVMPSIRCQRGCERCALAGYVNLQQTQTTQSPNSSRLLQVHHGYYKYEHYCGGRGPCMRVTCSFSESFRAHLCGQIGQ